MGVLASSPGHSWLYVLLHKSLHIRMMFCEGCSDPLGPDRIVLQLNFVESLCLSTK